MPRTKKNSDTTPEDIRNKKASDTGKKDTEKRKAYESAAQDTEKRKNSGIVLPEPESRKKYAEEIIRRLNAEYGRGLRVYLDHENAWQLLIATILSAQCTDRRVNIVTKTLFKKYPDLKSFAGADISELEQDIKSTGFYHNKAKNIKAAARMLIDDYGGNVPSEIDELIKLPGVGRKTANVIRGNIFNIPSVVVDTHVKRISNRLGLTDSQDPEKIEYDLMEVLPRECWIAYNIQIIALGRTICTARHPSCRECFLNDICPSGPAKILTGEI